MVLGQYWHVKVDENNLLIFDRLPKYKGYYLICPTLDCRQLVLR